MQTNFLNFLSKKTVWTNTFCDVILGHDEKTQVFPKDAEST